jgi:hypothetical protein
MTHIPNPFITQPRGNAMHLIAYTQINALPSVSQMKEALEKIPLEDRLAVIQIGLAKSTTQFTWSHFAKTYGLPEDRWPPSPYAATREAPIGTP